MNGQRDECHGHFVLWACVLEIVFGFDGERGARVKATTTYSIHHDEFDIIYSFIRPNLILITSHLHCIVFGNGGHVNHQRQRLM